MHKVQNALPAQSPSLSTRDLQIAFDLFDKDGSGKLKGDEVKDMLEIVCGFPVTVKAGVLTLKKFKTFIENLNKQHPEWKIPGHLLAYVKQHEEKGCETNALCASNCAQLFQKLDKNEDGTMEMSELYNMFKQLGLPWQHMLNKRSQSGSVTAADFQTMLQELDQQNPALDLGEKVLGFLGEIKASGKPEGWGDDAAPPAPVEKPAGKKKALLVGINYIGIPNATLGGCINDAKNTKDTLIEHFGFEEENVTLLTEDQEHITKKPTAGNIRNGFKWLFEGATQGDTLYFHYSGHGSQVPDPTGQEPDGQNECILPIDFDDWDRHIILDDEIHRVFDDNLPNGVHCICVFDCCHSGTVADLCCTRDFGPASFLPKATPRFLQPPSHIQDTLSELNRTDPKATARSLCNPWEAKENKHLWVFSGCQDNQTSKDVQIAGEGQGAFTYCLLKSLKESNYSITYDGLRAAAKKNITAVAMDQTPALSTTSMNNFTTKFLSKD